MSFFRPLTLLVIAGLFASNAHAIDAEAYLRCRDFLKVYEYQKKNPGAEKIVAPQLLGEGEARLIPIDSPRFPSHYLYIVPGDVPMVRAVKLAEQEGRAAMTTSGYTFGIGAHAAWLGADLRSGILAGDAPAPAQMKTVKLSEKDLPLFGKALGDLSLDDALELSVESHYERLFASLKSDEERATFRSEYQLACGNRQSRAPAKRTRIPASQR